MSVLFTPLTIGDLEIKNRFIHSGTYEIMADENGHVTEQLLKRYRNLSNGDIGMIIPGYMNVHPLGKATPHQTCIDSDDKIPGLGRLADAIHEGGSKACFQLAHAGRQTQKRTTGQRPIAPSSIGRDPMYMVKPRAMTEEDIDEVIEAYGKAGARAVEAGTDAIHISAGAGYLPNQFLSPYLNQRNDKWGGSDENRFRFVKEIVLAVRKNMPENMPLVMKLNAVDYTPKEGVTEELARKYAKWLSDLGIEALEITTGTTVYSNMHMWRGEIPVNEILRVVPLLLKPAARLVMSRIADKVSFEEMWNLKHARFIKPVLGETKMLIVGGNRRVEQMEELIVNNDADAISMCRPFIREPNLVKKIKEGKTQESACISCNKCVAAVVNDIPLRCYTKGLPYK
ncbi:MAG: NADH:flavin oxidoreductase [Proteobacteria bacterium]|nr:NADH:flavin oxidoreductase [Pseudomonadota bacterium]